jgi:hypothetical protein
LIYSVLISTLFCQIARTYLTPRKSTCGRFPRGQLAPHHQLEVVVEEEPEEVQPEDEIEEDPEEVQSEPEVEEDPEEVQQEEDPVEQPQLYDGTVLETDADGDIIILPAPEAVENAPPTPVAPTSNAMGGDPDDSGDDSGEDDEDNQKMMKILRKKRMMILAIVGLSTTSTPLKMRMASTMFYCRRYCSTWGTP